MEELIVENVIRWIVGLSFSLFLGGRVAAITVDSIRKNYIKKASVNDSDLEYFNNLFGEHGLEEKIGYIERFFFTICVAFNLSGLVIAMITWVGLKMLYIWAPGFKALEKLEGSEIEGKTRLFREFAMSSILGGVVSIIFALIAGLFIRYGFGVFGAPAKLALLAQ